MGPRKAIGTAWSSAGRHARLSIDFQAESAISTSPGPSWNRVARPHDAQIEHLRALGALLRGILYKHGLQSRLGDHRDERVGRRASIVFLQHHDAAGLEMPRNAGEKAAMHAPVRIMITQLAKARIDEVRRVAHHQIPLL